MGINWLTVAEFEQMLGRAGRLQKHELGYAYLLVEPGKIYSPKMKETEENIAIKLLNGKIKDFELPPNEDKSMTELLAFISMFIKGIDKKIIYDYFSQLVNNNFDLDKFLQKLNSLGLVRIKEDFTYKTTQLGRAIAKSFLTIEQCLEIIESINKNERTIIEIALNLKPIRNVYLSKRVVADLAKNINLKYLSNNLFSGSVLSLMNAESIKKRKKFSNEFVEFIMKFIKDIFNCKCKDNPYCDCGRLNLEKIILSLRIENEMQIEEICNYLEDIYKIILMKGDLISFLEELIHSLESIKDISEGLFNLKEKYTIELSEIPNIIEQIKY